jgi:hypothetical protein
MFGKFEKVEKIDVVSERNFCTKHGQHLNTGGKEIMSQKIATTIELPCSVRHTVTCCMALNTHTTA